MDNRYYKRQLLNMIKRYLYGGASHEEKEFLEKFYDHFDQDPDILDQFSEDEKQLLESEMHQNLLNRMILSEPKSTFKIWQTTWFRMASAACLILAFGIYLSQKPTFNNPSSEKVSSKVLDVAPGRNQAVLTLSNGESISLDASVKGTIAQEGQIKIKGSGDGELAYDLQADSKAVVTGLNTIATPAGGHYRLVLPDGSKVWLNAASSVSYPAVFSGPARIVRVTGECYFEVAKDPRHPFRVEVEGRQKITVLGTHFNVSAYSNDETINTTLLEGSVEVGRLEETYGTAANPIRLRVGEQASMGRSGMLSKKHVDVSQAVAWKDGLFHFQNADVRTVIRQIERWYNVKVVYEVHDDTEKFSGKIHRDANLSQMLEILRFSGLNFKLQPSADKTLSGELVWASAH